MTKTTAPEKAHPELDRAIEASARKLVDAWSSLTHAEASVAAKGDDAEVFALPMWGTIWRVEDGCDARKIKSLMRPLGADDEASAIALVREHLDAEILCDHYSCSDCGEFPSKPDAEKLAKASDPGADVSSECCGASFDLTDEAELVSAVNDAWNETDDEDCLFASSGWQRVGDTGILAVTTPDDEVLLGVNGAGYDFFGAHWIPLYKALGYEWHTSTLRETRLGWALDELSKVQGTEAILATVEHVRQAYGRLREGGPLKDEEVC